ncbi:hypothetical protein NL676_034918 [Syzygium grande]|nr:hypothetical protein NL676_034918 [Syzygium grande]
MTGKLLRPDFRPGEEARKRHFLKHPKRQTSAPRHPHPKQRFRATVDGGSTQERKEEKRKRGKEKPYGSAKASELTLAADLEERMKESATAALQTLELGEPTAHDRERRERRAIYTDARGIRTWPEPEPGRVGS